MTARRLLGLDISSRRYGWATFDGHAMKCGSAHCPVPRPINPSTGKSTGELLNAQFTGAVLDWQTHRLRALYEMSEPDAIGIEEPLNSNSGVQTTSATIHMHAAVAANAARIAVSMSIPVTYVHQSEWRAAFGVRSLAKADRRTLTGTPSEWLKREAMRCAKLQGADPQNGDEGDACGVVFWMWARERQARLELFATAGR